MGKTARLTAVKVKNLKDPGRYGDGDGLYLNIAPGGSKSWVQRITVNGQRRDLGLGEYPQTSLAEARDHAYNNKKAFLQGQDPARANKGRLQTTKRAVASPRIHAASIVHSLNGARWASEKTKNNWWQRAERYVFPAIGEMPVDQVGRIDVLEILTPVWVVKPETARRLRQIIKTVMAWAIAYGHISANPAGEMIDAALPAMPKVAEHFRALHYADVGAAIRTVEASSSFPATKLCFRFLVLTAVRSAEARYATWDEIDLEKALWTIPAARMKMKKEHRVPLSTQALEVLDTAKLLPTNGNTYIFPNDLTPEKAFSENTLGYMLRRLGIPATVHGFRSSFRDWAAENTSASFAVMELALAHGVGSSVVQSYARSDLLSRRRPKLTNEVQHFVKVLAWENIMNMSPLKNGVKWPVYVPRDRQSAKSQQVWIARHQQLLEN